MNRNRRAKLARETLAILETGRYRSPDGGSVFLRDDLRAAVEGSRVYTPDELPLRAPPATGRSTVEVTQETTLQAAQRLGGEVVVLTFASAKNPGGGFLGGSQAQEESLARSSGLYECLLACPEYYDANRNGPRGYYTDHLIYSPRVPVFRADDGTLLSGAYPVSFITAPAVNAGALAASDRGNVRPTMARRIENVFSVAHHHGHPALVLGAWGCGVFRNHPDVIAELFRDAMSAWRAAFEAVTFAIPGEGSNHRAFASRLR